MTRTNFDIAITHITTRRKQTLVTILGITIGVAIYLFMNSLSTGFSKFSRDEIFKINAHIKIFKDDEISKPISDDSSMSTHIIVNPRITTASKKIINPMAILEETKAQPYVTNAIVQVNFDAFYNQGVAQVRGSGNGVAIKEYDKMFSTGKYMVAGSLDALENNLNGILIGSGIAEKLNVGLNENITVSSSFGVVKTMKVVGIFKTGSSLTDNGKSYMNISTAQQFVKEGASFVSTIFINTLNPDESEKYMNQLQRLTEYKVEDWKTTNADILGADKTRGTLMTSISFSILFVAAFGIYNILSSTISQKINDIAILKATGFTGNDVIEIFLMEALIMGTIGTMVGLGFGAVLISIMSKVYMGPPVGYFPIFFDAGIFIRSFLLGVVLTACAGYFPAKKAANVDPVSIFRK
jgi:lipoprotein-releasing system permease protein